MTFSGKHDLCHVRFFTKKLIPRARELYLDNLLHTIVFNSEKLISHFCGLIYVDACGSFGDLVSVSIYICKASKEGGWGSEREREKCTFTNLTALV